MPEKIREAEGIDNPNFEIFYDTTGTVNMPIRWKFCPKNTEIPIMTGIDIDIASCREKIPDIIETMLEKAARAVHAVKP